jgi:RimJ/RimL family protein N-acetyltransferase
VSSDNNLIVHQTEHLFLRRWVAADFGPFAEMNQHPAVMEFFPRTLTPEESAAMIQRMESFFDETGYGRYALELRSTGEFIGFTGLSRVTFEPWPWPPVEIGWRLKKTAWGNGYAAEAARVCLDEAFQVYGLKEICSFTSLLNVRSERVMQKLGMVRAGEFDHPRIGVGNPLCRHVAYRG